MKEFLGTVSRNVIILLIISLLFTSSCSRKMNLASSSRENEIRSVKTSERISDNYDDNLSEIKKIESDINDLAEKSRPGATINPDATKGLKTERIKAEDIIQTALEYFGVPHCMGGLTKKCIDCSGLLVKVFAAYGIILPHSAQEQSRYGETITRKDDLVKGDLVFFTRSYKTRNFITHTGIYAGENKFIHASSHKGVSITSLDDPYWKQKFVFGKRILE